MKIIFCSLVLCTYSTLAISENVATFDPETNTVHIPVIQIVGDESGNLYSAEMTKAENGTYSVASVIELTNIWDSDSTDIKIVEFNGYTPNSDDRYTEIRYNISTLTKEALDKLSSIKTTRDNLLCWEDANYYSVVITNNLGQERYYYTNYNACNENNFIKRIDVEELLVFLN